MVITSRVPAMWSPAGWLAARDSSKGVQERRYAWGKKQIHHKRIVYHIRLNCCWQVDSMYLMLIHFMTHRDLVKSTLTSCQEAVAWRCCITCTAASCSTMSFDKLTTLHYYLRILGPWVRNKISGSFFFFFFFFNFYYAPQEKSRIDRNDFEMQFCE